jgi:diaminopimelate decarboxylase
VLARRLRENASEFLAVNGVGRTRAEVYYSYKSNPVPGVLQLLHGLGIGAEVISEYELWLALKLCAGQSHRFQRAGEIDRRHS